ncbi:hypothetical protein DXG03_004452, partial [Asterophora parasitica]
MAMEAAELARWTRFAAKGGIGKCTAIEDCVAESADDLMFLKDDEITVLMQLTEPQGIFLGYCEGVVGRFSGADVHFHSKLKKPVMAKRSSVTAANPVKPSTPMYGASTPMLTSDSPVPSLTGTTTRTRVSVEHHFSSSTALNGSLYDQAGKGSYGESVLPSAPLLASSSSTVSDQAGRGSYGSPRGSVLHEKSDGEASSTPWTAPSASTTSPTPSGPVLPERSDAEGSLSSIVAATPSSPPRTTLSPPRAPSHLSSGSTSTTGTLVDASSAPVPRTLTPASPPRPSSYISSRHASLLSSYSQSTANENDFDPTIHATTRPVTPPVSTSLPSPPISPPTAPTTSPPSPPAPNTSSELDQDDSRISLALSDGEANIGLSFLQDAINGGAYDEWFDSDSDEQVVGRKASTRRRGSGRVKRVGSRSSRGQQEDSTRLGAWRRSVRDSVISEGSKYSSEGETSDGGLGYEDTETGHGSNAGTEEQLEADLTQTQQAFIDLSSSSSAPSRSNSQRISNSTATPFASSPSAHQMSFTPVAPLSPRFKVASMSAMAIPLQQTQIQGPAKGEDYDTSSDWEGAAAADIYDDYRYSRYSVASTRTGFSGSSKRMSVSSKFSMAGGIGSGIPPFVDDPEARSRADSAVSRPSVDSQRPSLVESPPQQSVQLPQARRRSKSNATAGFSPLAGVVAAATSPPHSPKLSEILLPSPYPDGSFPSHPSSPLNPDARFRPAPLNLVTDQKRSPLLHTTWGSPLSPTAQTVQYALIAPLSPTRGPRSPHHLSPPTSSASNTGYTGTGEGFGGPRGLPASATYFPAQGSGMASAIRERFELERKSTVVENAEDDTDEAKERRIVVEDDEDEIVIGQDVSFASSTVSTVVAATADVSIDSTVSEETIGASEREHEEPSIASSPEPEPEMVSKGRLAPLVVANRSTPSPAGDDEDEADEKEKAALRKVAESLPPLASVSPRPPVNGLPAATTFSPTPPPTASSSTLHPPPSPSSSTSPAPPPSHLRPSLNELRGLQPGQEPAQRQSLFLPHPNAPKAPSGHSPGPMYIAQQQPPPPPRILRGGVMQTLRMALGGQGPQGGPRGRGPTIYGIMTEDLSAATGPVLMQFSVTPPPATAPPPGSVPPPASPILKQNMAIPAVSVTGPPQIVAPVPRPAVRRVGSMASLDAAAVDAAEKEVEAGAAATRPGSGPIPRANFFPKAGTARPRSRSFSGFQSTSVEVPMPYQRSREEGSQPIDMDFELVRPNIAQFQGSRNSEDSGVMGRDSSVDARQDAHFLRADSPAVSVTSRSPVVSDSSSGMWQQPAKASPQPRAAESESSMDAHRQRELKWMSVMGAVPPAQSRKNKKVKKLIFDGVPSSVRYLVWSHLTDGKARFVPGVYTQLGRRGRVPVLVEVAKDVQRSFADHPQLLSTQGPVISLLQAYLTMVPDVQYTTGLTLITGHLLLLAPEEDAFWIFVSIMDTHIRPYFSFASNQLDVDASLFHRALEAIDPGLAKKIFTDLAISPSAICRPWFTSLFVGNLPLDYVNRVWDIFLFEGVPFLFRVALALVSCCRRQLLDSTSADSLLGNLLRPASNVLPSSPEALITLALSVKLKDDDIRKQRVKLEAQ